MEIKWSSLWEVTGVEGTSDNLDSWPGGKAQRLLQLSDNRNFTDAK